MAIFPQKKEVEEEEVRADGGEDLPVLQVEPSPAAEELGEQVVKWVDVDLPAMTIVADIPAPPILLEDTDVPASSALADHPDDPFDLEKDAPTASAPADLPAEPLDLEIDVPASSAVADVPAEEMVPARESAAQLMEGDEVDDPFSDEGASLTLTPSAAALKDHGSSTVLLGIREPNADGGGGTAEKRNASNKSTLNRLSP